MKSLSMTRVLAWLVTLVLAACSSLPDKPQRASLYDLGPSPEVAAAPAAPGAPIVLSDIEAVGALDSSQMLYRLGYADDHQLKPYSLSRWSAPPPQLVRQRLRQQLGRDRAVLDFTDSAALAREGALTPRVLRIDLEEFTHYFESDAKSQGVVRLRATLMNNTVGGEKLVAQRSFAVRRDAPTPDAPGGARALSAATDAAAQEIAQWLRGLP
jgi:cholesterol transport system auxiliary component